MDARRWLTQAAALVETRRNQRFLESEPHVTIIDSRLIVAFTLLQMANHPLHWLFYFFILMNIQENKWQSMAA